MNRRRRSSKWDDPPPRGWPPDDELVIRRFQTSQVRNRQRERATALFLRIRWGELTSALKQITTDRSTRLWLALVMTRMLDKSGPDDWLVPRQWALRDLGIDGPHYSVALARLERQGVIEVDRRSGKRALVRLVKEKSAEKPVIQSAAPV
jgi:hypothetical protein